MKYYILLSILCNLGMQAADFTSRLLSAQKKRQQLEQSIAERQKIQTSICGCDDMCPINYADAGECINGCSSVVCGVMASYVLSEANPMTKLWAILLGGSAGSQVGTMLKEWYLTAHEISSIAMVEPDDTHTPHQKVY
jgi:hypothetical protein